jgi:hypothetical protein
VTATIRVNPSSPRDTRLWSLTSQVTHILTGVPGVLIGGQMVAILETEHGSDLASRRATSMLSSMSAPSRTAHRGPQAGSWPQASSLSSTTCVTWLVLG